MEDQPLRMSDEDAEILRRVGDGSRDPDTDMAFYDLWQAVAVLCRRELRRHAPETHEQAAARMPKRRNWDPMLYGGGERG